MGMCKPSGGINEPVYGPYRGSIDKRKDKPNSRTDYFDEVTGELLQQRWYGPDGMAIWDRDWDHSNKHKHTFPHDHYWVWDDLGNSDRKAYDGPNGSKINLDYC